MTNANIFGEIIKSFVLSCLRGAAQVIFSANALTGFIFVMAICYGAVQLSKPSVAMGAIIGLIASTLAAQIFRCGASAIEKGLFGYNGFLVGIAIPIFFDVSFLMWILLITLTTAAAPLTAFANRILQPLRLPTLTFPFVLLTWAGVAFGREFLRQSSVVASTSATLNLNLGANGVLSGFSQIFLINNSTSGILILLALLISSKRFAFWGVIGSALSFFLSVVFGLDKNLLFSGFYGYNSALVGIALGAVFLAPGIRASAFAILGIFMSVVMQVFLIWALETIQLPSLTASFVLVTWICLWTSTLPRSSVASSIK